MLRDIFLQTAQFETPPSYRPRLTFPIRDGRGAEREGMGEGGVRGTDDRDEEGAGGI